MAVVDEAMGADVRWDSCLCMKVWGKGARRRVLLFS
jgi:hypothetical protein